LLHHDIEHDAQKIHRMVGSNTNETSWLCFIGDMYSSLVPRDVRYVPQGTEYATQIQTRGED